MPSPCCGWWIVGSLHRSTLSLPMGAEFTLRSKSFSNLLKEQENEDVSGEREGQSRSEKLRNLLLYFAVSFFCVGW